jgi:4-hydroxybenzoate polyprenyltransferase
MLARYQFFDVFFVFFTERNYQDKADDVRAGVKSTALLFGSWIKPILALFAFAFIFLLAVSGYLNGNGAAYFLISVGGSLLHFLWQLVTLRVNDPRDCWQKFQVGSNFFL